ncbi:MAG: outer membrane beta-barrel protein [Rikenellaceae bacterium]
MNRLFKAALLTVAATIATFSAQAEVVNLGLSGGVNYAHYSIKGLDGAISNDSGFNVGVSAGMKILFLSVTPELIYSQSNFELTHKAIMGQSASVKSKSLDLPVMFGYNLIKPIRLEAGPSFSLYSNAKATVGSNSVNIGRVDSTIGYVAGVSVRIFKFSVGARFNGQFGGKDNDFDSSHDYNVRKYSYSLRFGYRF